MEKGAVDEIFFQTAHPYTKGLLESIATLDTDKNAKLKPIDGTPPDLFSPPPGCPFAARCQYGMGLCSKEMPAETELSEEHCSWCWLQDARAQAVEKIYQKSQGEI